MSDKFLTSMNSTLVLSQDEYFPAGVQIEGFSTDAMIQADDAEKGIAVMGVDGKMSVARVPYITNFTVTLQSDSDSNGVFDAIEDYERIKRNPLKCRFTLTVPALNAAYTFNNCIITNVNPIPPHARTIGARAYKIACERVDRVILS